MLLPATKSTKQHNQHIARSADIQANHINSFHTTVLTLSAILTATITFHTALQ